MEPHHSDISGNPLAPLLAPALTPMVASTTVPTKTVHPSVPGPTMSTHTVNPSAPQPSLMSHCAPCTDTTPTVTFFIDQHLSIEVNTMDAGVPHSNSQKKITKDPGATIQSPSTGTGETVQSPNANSTGGTTTSKSTQTEEVHDPRETTMTPGRRDCSTKCHEPATLRTFTRLALMGTGIYIAACG